MLPASATDPNLYQLLGKKTGQVKHLLRNFTLIEVNLHPESGQYYALKWAWSGHPSGEIETVFDSHTDRLVDVNIYCPKAPRLGMSPDHWLVLCRRFGLPTVGRHVGKGYPPQIRDKNGRWYWIDISDFEIGNTDRRPWYAQEIEVCNTQADWSDME